MPNYRRISIATCASHQHQRQRCPDFLRLVSWCQFCTGHWVVLDVDDHYCSPTQTARSLWLTRERNEKAYWNTHFHNYDIRPGSVVVNGQAFRQAVCSTRYLWCNDRKMYSFWDIVLTLIKRIKIYLTICWAGFYWDFKKCPCLMLELCTCLKC